jgi:hypothetical protein
LYDGDITLLCPFLFATYVVRASYLVFLMIKFSNRKTGKEKQLNKRVELGQYKWERIGE